MKTASKFLCITFLFFNYGCRYFQPNTTAKGDNNEITIVQNEATQDGNNENEDFFNFFINFNSDLDFQLSRIKFPLQKIGLSEDYTKIDTVYLNNTGERIFISIYYDNLSYSSYEQFYDNFEHKLRDTDERVFARYGNGNGIEVFYYFKRINGLWYLVKVEDFST